MTWVLPSTISAHAQDMQDSASLCESFSKTAEQSLTWRSKLSPARTWSRRWKRESWIRALSGRIFEPSTADRIVGSWMSSLADSRASPSALQEREKPTKTPGTSFRTLRESSMSASLRQSSWKMSTEYLQARWVEKNEHQFSSMCWEDWKRCTTQRRSEYSQRRKSVPRTNDRGSSSWRWPTSTVGDSRNSARHSTKTGISHDGTTLIDVADVLESRSQGLADSIGEEERSKGRRAGTRSITPSGVFSESRRWPALPGKEQFKWESPRTLEPGLERTPDERSRWVDRLRLLGNGIVPAQAAHAYRILSNQLREDYANE